MQWWVGAISWITQREESWNMRRWDAYRTFNLLRLLFLLLCLRFGGAANSRGKTGGSPTVLSAFPENLNATAQGARDILVTWTPMVTPPSSWYEVKLYNGDGIMEHSSNFSAATSMGKFIGLTPFTTYLFDIAACRLSGTSGVCGPTSPQVQATTWPGVPEPPAEVTAEPYTYDSIHVSWRPPPTINGILEKYEAVMRDRPRACFSFHPNILRCILPDVPPKKTVWVQAYAYTRPNDQGEGGGKGIGSPLIAVTMWDGALNVTLLDELTAEDFNTTHKPQRSTVQIALLLPLSRIPLQTTGGFSNVTIVIQPRKTYNGDNTTSVNDYGSTEYGVYHTNPISGTYKHKTGAGEWEVILSELKMNAGASAFLDQVVVIGSEGGYPLDSHYFDGVTISVATMLGSIFAILVVMIVAFVIFKRFQHRRNKALIQEGIANDNESQVIHDTWRVPPVNIKDFNAYATRLLNSPDDDLGRQFQLLRNFEANQSQRFQLTTKVAKQLCDSPDEPQPYDQSLVLLGCGWSEYLNAPKFTNAEHSILVERTYVDASYICYPEVNQISGEVTAPPHTRQPKFIVATSPRDNSKGDFLYMLLKQKTTVVVMMDASPGTTALEGVQYWPEDVLDNFESANHTCEVLLKSLTEKRDWCKRHLLVRPINSSKSWEFVQLQFLGWSNRAFPRVDVFYNFVLKIIKLLGPRPVGAKYGPLVVHSQKRDGRAGTLVCALALLNQLRTSPLHIDVFGTVLVLSRYRPELLKNKTQLQFLYRFIQYAIETERVISSSTYADEN